jgi:hypothetical protein
VLIPVDVVLETSPFPETVSSAGRRVFSGMTLTVPKLESRIRFIGITALLTSSNLLGRDVQLLRAAHTAGSGLQGLTNLGLGYGDLTVKSMDTVTTKGRIIQTFTMTYNGEA